MRKTPVLPTLLLVLLAVTLVSGIFSKSYSIKAKGKLKKIGVNVFWDSSLTDPVTLIDWGILEPGETKDVQVYVKNESNIEGDLSLTTDLWIPPIAETEISLTWDYDGVPLTVDEARAVTLTLVIDDTPTVTDFEFDIIITITAI